ncbi:hypothetical protein DMENIID0001_164470 [Sergentomyia squamirostris]
MNKSTIAIILVSMLAVVNSQRIPPKLISIGLPCLVKAGISPFQLLPILQGNYTNLPILFGPIGCISDCISKGLGFVGNKNTFLEDKFVAVAERLLKPDLPPKLLELCRGQIGKENCKVTVYFFVCFITESAVVIFDT